MAKKKPAAAQVLEQVAKPSYWQQELGLRTPSPYSDDPTQGYGPHGPRRRPENPPTAGGGGGGGGGAGGGGGGAEAPAVPDWEQVLVTMGMPGDLVNQLNDYMRAHADDPDLQTKVISIVRGTDWWKQTFPGFWEGAAHGLFSNETGYRAWYAGANDAFKRYYNRDLTASEVVNYLHQGYGASDVEQVGAGHAYAEANKGDINYVEGAFDTGQLTPDQVEQYGQYKAGKGNAAGAALDTRIQNAINKMQRVFQGTLASPNFGINSQGLLQSQGPKTPDVGA